MYDSELSYPQPLGEQDRGSMQRWKLHRHPLGSAYDNRPFRLFLTCLTLIALPCATFALGITHQVPINSFPSLSLDNNGALLECVQIARPIAIPSAACQQILMVHDFALSYGQPFIGTL